MRVDLFATEAHYFERLALVWQQLRKEEQGTVLIPQHLEGLAAARGVTTGAADHEPPWYVLCASYGDAVSASQVGRRTTVLLEHGVGQSYGNHPAYAGGHGRPAGWVYLCPNLRTGRANQRGNLTAAVHVIGDVYMDWLDQVAVHRLPAMWDGAVSFHWNGCEVAPEAGSTRRYWWPGVVHASSRYSLVGHAHPRETSEARALYEGAGMPFLHSLESVVQGSARSFICDNSSAMFYCAALDIPVVVLSAPQYRRDVEWGCRFWEYADVGVEVSTVDGLMPAIGRTLEYPEAHRDRRAEVSAELFPFRDGESASRAVSVLRALA